MLQKRRGTVIPVSRIRTTNSIHRAMLFKAVADKVGIPSTLIDGQNGTMWNQVPITVRASEKESTCLLYGVVDLMGKIGYIGKILLVGSKDADTYCRTYYESEYSSPIPSSLLPPPQEQEDSKVCNFRPTRSKF